MQLQCPNLIKNFSYQILILLLSSQYYFFESEFQSPNPNFYDEIAVPISQLEFQCPNLHFGNKGVIPTFASEFRC